jgi:hypothetical protein
MHRLGRGWAIEAICIIAVEGKEVDGFMKAGPVQSGLPGR